jgi:NAD(P)-dependent dehydrogenase (short-subunit alcohol dehydrogenase family)
MGSLDGKVVLVTGGASGIGLATASRLAAEGAHVMIVDRDRAAGKEAAARLGGQFTAADVARPEDWSAVLAAVEAAFGGLDVAYLNAGVTTGEGEIARVTDQQYRRILGANVDGVVFGVRAVVPALERRGGGAIVVTASLAGLSAFPPDPIYTLTKHAVVGLVRALAPQLSPLHITINAICPAVVDTPLLGDEGRDRLRSLGVPLIDPAEIADAVLGRVLGGDTGEAWMCRAGRSPTPYRWRGLDDGTDASIEP